MYIVSLSRSVKPVRMCYFIRMFADGEFFTSEKIVLVK
jgi:hypothetical protein